MTFAYPWVLLLFPVTYLVVRYQIRKNIDGVSTPSLMLWEHISNGRERFLWIPKLLIWITIGCGIIALARPQSGTSKSMQVTEGIAIQMLVDVSSSMDMATKAPDRKHKTRMDIAKELVEAFIVGDEENLMGRPNDMIGLITFARYPDTRSPLTFGHSALVQIVRSLEIQDRANEDGTAYGDALALAAARLQQLEEQSTSNPKSFIGEVSSKVIILLTDGENNSGKHLPVEAAGLAQKWKCKIYSISLGDSSSYSSENPSELSPGEKLLEHICNETGGHFRKAHDYDSLKSVYEEIDKLETSKISTRNYTQVTEWFWVPLLLGFFSWIFAMLLDSTQLRTVK